MGCIHSRSICEAHPNRFEVIFMDIEGTESYIPGQIEITANDLILYWKSRDEIIHQWPVGTLRRYGYDDGHFSFESGRRCQTGPGIFKFKCNRSDVLFNTLQSVINGRTYNAEEAMSNMHDSLVLPNISNRNIAHLNNLNLGATGTTGHNGSMSLSPNGTNSIQSRSNDALNAEGNYLEPIGNRPAQIQVSRLSSNMRLSSLGSPTSPGSPSSYTNILEITSFSHPPTTQQQGNIYQESNPGASTNLIAARKPLRLSLDITPNEPAPQSAPILPKINNDVSNNIYMNSLIGSMEFADKDENDNTTPVLIQEKVIEKPAPLQIPKSPDSNNLSVEPLVRTPTAAGAVYMNVALGESQSVSTPPFINAKENIQPINITPPTTANNLNNNLNNIKKDYTKHLVNGNIFGFNRLQSIDPNRCYENLEPGAPELNFVPRHRYSRPEIFSNVDLPIIERTDKSEPCTPTVALRRVNYIVLDLGQSTNTINNNNNNINNINNNNNFNNTTINNNLSSSSCNNFSSIIATTTTNGVNSSNCNNSSNNNTNNNTNNNGSSDNGLNCLSDNIPTSLTTSVSMTNGLLPPESPLKADYATIDFNKTVALSNSTRTPSSDLDQEGSRKTRHDSNVTPVINTTTKHSNSIIDDRSINIK